MKLELVSVSLTPQQQALWLEFEKQQDNISKIIGSGALNIRNGAFTCHVDGGGKIKAIDKQERLVV